MHERLSDPAEPQRSTLGPEWQTAMIRSGEVHVWHGSLEADPEPVAPAEAARARRMRAPSRHHEFLVCRGALRRILAATLGIDPLAIPLIDGSHGKPMLGPGDLPPVGFNVSHSGDRFMVVVAAALEPGADIERIRPRRSLPALARRFFSRAEREEVAAAPDPLHAFYRIWTRKEAVVKADGRGVGIGLGRFDVNAGEPPFLLRARWNGAEPDEAARWSLRSLDAGPGHVAALAVRSPGVEVVVRSAAVPSARHGPPSAPEATVGFD